MTGLVQLLGISNAIVDVLAHVDEAFLEKVGVPRGAMTLLLTNFPVLVDFFPIGGVGQLGEVSESFEPVYSSLEDTVLAPEAAIKLGFAMLGAGILIVPVSWVYFITSRDKNIDQSFVQTIIIILSPKSSQA